MNRSLLMLFALVSVSGYADQNCLQTYINYSSTAGKIGQPLAYLSEGMTLGGTTAAIAGTSSGGAVVPVLILGGTSVGSTASGLNANALFAGNVAQTMVEANAKVVGPYTTALAADLNDAIYDSGRFTRKTDGTTVQVLSPLNDETKAQLNGLLGGKKVSSTQLAAAMNLLISTGGLCKPDGSTLGEDEWARIVVPYAIQQAQ